ncbi:MAG TPA: GGDEF domain-containing protein [Xanthobacteraceae bacterium]|nr:GGDEF domain-containing protein [Xanthobacteraceae bacterium]
MLDHGSIPFSLDVTTLFIVATCVTALLGLFMLFAWTQDRIRALAWWGAAYLIGGFSVALWLCGQRAIPFMPAALPSALLFLACGMIWNAARLFHARKMLWTAMAAGAVVWMLACTTTVFPPMGTNRIILASLIVSAYTFLTAAELWRERRKALMRRWPALFVPVLHGAVFLFPIPIASLMPNQSGLVTLAAGWIGVFVLEMLLYAVGAAFIVLVLTKERTLRTHKTAALTDPLTGLFNRRGLIEATRELTANRNPRPFTVLAFDLDHFKSINDRFGHAVGDEVLRLFASVASTSLRVTDFVSRLGGEEFAAIIPGSLDEGIMIAERVRVAFESAARTVAGRYLGATVSVGVAAHAAATNFDALLARADEALYVAKRAGRNRVEAELPHVDAPRIVPAPAAAPSPALSPATALIRAANTIEWSTYQRPRGTTSQREAA